MLPPELIDKIYKLSIDMYMQDIKNNKHPCVKLLNEEYMFKDNIICQTLDYNNYYNYNLNFCVKCLNFQMAKCYCCYTKICICQEDSYFVFHNNIFICEPCDYPVS